MKKKDYEIPVMINLFIKVAIMLRASIGKFLSENSHVLLISFLFKNK